MSPVCQLVDALSLRDELERERDELSAAIASRVKGAQDQALCVISVLSPASSSMPILPHLHT